MRKKGFKDRFQSAYDGLRTDQNKYLIYPALILYRRLTIPASVILFSDSLTGQYCWILLTSTAVLCYLLDKKPFDGKFKNRAVILEELIITVLIYHILCFTDWMPDTEVRQDLGTSFITIVMSIMIVYHSYGLVKCGKQIKRKLYIRTQKKIAEKVRS